MTLYLALQLFYLKFLSFFVDGNGLVYSFNVKKINNNCLLPFLHDLNLCLSDYEQMWSWIEWGLTCLQVWTFTLCSWSFLSELLASRVASNCTELLLFFITKRSSGLPFFYVNHLCCRIFSQNYNFIFLLVAVNTGNAIDFFSGLVPLKFLRITQINL